MCSTAGSRTGVLSISACHDVGGVGTGAAIPFHSPTSKERPASSLTARAAFSLMPCFFSSVFVTNLLQTVKFHRGTLLLPYSVSSLLAARLGRCSVPPAAHAPQTGITASQIFRLMSKWNLCPKDKGWLYFLFYFWPHNSFNLLLNGRI